METQPTNEELAASYQAGDPDALLQLWNRNQALIHNVIRYYHNTMEQDDLEQESFLGLQAAASRYKPESGAPFGTYMAYSIRWEISQYLCANGNAVHITPLMWRNIREAKQAQEDLQRQLHRDPTQLEIADALGITLADYLNIETAIHLTQLESMDRVIPGEEGGGETLGAFVADPEDHMAEVEEAINNEELGAVLWGIVDELPGAEADIVRMIYKDSKEPEQVAKDLQITRKELQRSRTKAMARLRDHKKELQPYYDQELRSRALRNTGLSAFKNSGTSATEREAIRLFEEEEAKRQRYVRECLANLLKKKRK